VTSSTPNRSPRFSELKYAYDRDVALNDNGEYLIGWSDGSLGGDPDYIRIVEGSIVDGRLVGEHVFKPDRELRDVDVDIDRAGRMAVLWLETRRDRELPEGGRLRHGRTTGG